MAAGRVKKAAAGKTASKAVRAGSSAGKGKTTMPREGRDPKGGLTQAGRDFFARRDGSHLKPGVTGKADTPEKMLRKGSFLVRTFTHPRGPMVDPKGQPTRLALSAHAWGEKVPKSVSEAHTLAAKGHTLLAKYHAEQDKAQAKPGRSAVKTAGRSRAAASKSAGSSASKSAGRKSAAAKKPAARSASPRRSPAHKGSR